MNVVFLIQERLTEMGEWLSINGIAVYGSKPWRAQNDSINSHVWYTCQPDSSVHFQAEKTTKELREFIQQRKLMNANSAGTKANLTKLRAAEEKWKRYIVHVLAGCLCYEFKLP